MQDLTIFNNPEFGEIRTTVIDGEAGMPPVIIHRERGRPSRLSIGGIDVDRFWLLSHAAEQENKKYAWWLLNLASICFHPDDDSTFNTLYATVAMSIAQSDYFTEFSVHEAFKNNVTIALDGTAKIIRKTSDGRNYPDAWVFWKGEEMPVEIKRGNFGEKALAQLKRYMKVYGCAKGVAVGKKLTTELPDEIHFVPYSKFMRKGNS